MKTVKQYYAEQSYGRFNVTWAIKPKIYINEPKSKYDADTKVWHQLYADKIAQAGVDMNFPGGANLVMMASPQVSTINSQAGPPFIQLYHHKTEPLLMKWGIQWVYATPCRLKQVIMSLIQATIRSAITAIHTP
ncbi:hypothetical protein [Pseudoalteromonas luteoviolacea]|uniref:Uncharacterized protein n=1 Tax=Pseudoalteromonas luteoviolacea NCIMB 1942 TaxID=1365253 RepID=A0A167DF56_9GAMM|nr:hypothetical protein [Pseudoalteromonas luteoviolacea]KZN48760.1 hypothetical protein N482_07050 [Pseudoalteromonas luteoviolacea NCIMB 1942]